MAYVAFFQAHVRGKLDKRAEVRMRVCMCMCMYVCVSARMCVCINSYSFRYIHPSD
jgi:hypothetical protein